MALKWGILSAGKISHDFVNALGTLRADEHQVVAVAARDLDRAKEFAQRFDIPKAYGSYLELAQDPDIEVVYIGTLHTHHLNASMLMLDHGKHVLCEKPLCMNERQVQELVAYAKEKNLFLMEAIYARCSPCYQYIREQIESGIIGEIESIEMENGTSAAPNMDHKLKKSLGGGVVINIGVYPIQFCQWVFQQEPKSIYARGTLNDDGVDVEVFAELQFGSSRVGKLKLTFLTVSSFEAKIVGTRGTLMVPRFFGPESVIGADGTEKFHYPLPQAKYKFNFTNACGLRYEAAEVRRCIRAGKIESEFVSHSDSMGFARIEDQIRKQIGVEYSEDVKSV